MTTDYRALAAQMGPESNGRDPLESSGLTALHAGCDLGDVATALRRLVPLLPADRLERRVIRNKAIGILKEARIQDATGLVDDALPRAVENGDGVTNTLTLHDPAPSTDPQDGPKLLSEIVNWLTGYVYLPPKAADAVALWVAATWYVGVADFAPLLALLSATKRCGKTLLLYLLQLVVRRGYGTSGSGVTTAVLFRLNDKYSPTFCIDEAERLSGRDADRELIGLLNAGYRRGARVQRCVERNGDFEVLEFDAFGFRALASIRSLWDTMIDRSVVVWLERKPSVVRVRRFAGRVADVEGAEFSKRFARWVADAATGVRDALLDVPRPDWLHDRACDNWSTLFAVAQVAGGDWPTRALEAAQALEAGAQAADPTETLLHDVARLWQSEEWTEVVASGELVEKLNALETSPWGSYGKNGKGLTTHTLSALFRSLKVRPRQARAARGVVRGYWYVDLEPIFERYPLPAEPVQSVQVVQDSARADEPVPVVPPAPVVPVEAGHEQDAPGFWEPAA